MKLPKLVSLLLVLALIAAACGSSADTATDVVDEVADEAAGEDEAGGDVDEGSEDGGATAAAGLDIDAILAADLDNCAAEPTGDLIQVGMALDFSEVTGFVDIPGSMLGPFVAEKINCSGAVSYTHLTLPTKA